VTTWPTLVEAKAFLRLQDDPTQDDLVDDARLAAIDYATGRVDPKWITEGDPPELPEGLRQAALQLTGRLYRRRDSLDGTTGWSDVGVVRVGSRDPDVESLLGRYLAWPVA
jgi:hypothetical protein